MAIPSVATNISDAKLGDGSSRAPGFGSGVAQIAAADGASSGLTAPLLRALAEFRRRFDTMDRTLAADRGFFLDILV
jgi:hypothetical protein